MPRKPPYYIFVRFYIEQIVAADPRFSLIIFGPLVLIYCGLSDSILSESNMQEKENLYEVDIEYNVRVPVRDGLTLSANLFMPAAKHPGETFPAVLEMIPYRKGDWRYRADHKRMTWLAMRGYVGCRLDIRGTGSSPGIALDEYTDEETRDGYDAVQWLAARPWCNGNVGMWGISYGGFTSVQVAKLAPPALKAIVVMYATDDRYTDDVHYIGGCMTGSEFAQYAVSQIAMNAMPPNPNFTQGNWAEEWKDRLEKTPPWILDWIRRQKDGPYWRRGSLAPDYERISCALFHIGGWADGYTNAVLRMQEKCVNAPRKALIGPWVHSPPDVAYPGPNIDWLHEMKRFFDFWLKGIQNGVMDDPCLTVFLQEYTPPEPFPRVVNGSWRSEKDFPIDRTQMNVLHLNDGGLSRETGRKNRTICYPHRPTLGTCASLCWGSGAPPNGLARDLRPDEALSLIFTSDALEHPLDVIGFPEAVLFLGSRSPVANVVVRLTDVAPDGTSAHVSSGVLNLTHRHGHGHPIPLEPGKIDEVRVPLKATGYRFLPGHRIRLSIASGWWPVLWPSPYRGMNLLKYGPGFPSRLLLPVVPGEPELPPHEFKLSSPRLIDIGSGHEEEPRWEIIDDVIKQSVTVMMYSGEKSILPNQSNLFSSEKLEMTAFKKHPANAQLYKEVIYQLQEYGYEIEITATGAIRSTRKDFHVDIQLEVVLNGNLFFRNSWLESIPRLLV